MLSENPSWDKSWAARRYRYLRPFSKPIPFHFIARRGSYVTYGHIFFWVTYLILNVAVLTLLILDSITTGSQATSKTNAIPQQGSNHKVPIITNGAASAIGTYGTFLMSLALIPINRNSLLVFLLNLPLDRAIKYHRWQAYFAVLALAAHGATYVVFYSNKHLFPNGIASQMWDGVTGLNESGVIAWYCSAAVVLTSLPLVRRWAFELFLRCHIVLFLAFIIFAVIHQTLTLLLLAPPLILYSVEIFLRIRNARKQTQVLSLKILPNNVVRLEFATKSLAHKPGQYIFVCIPSISALEWHPFSISSSPHDAHMSVHIRVLGTWTTSVAELAQSLEGSTASLPKLLVDGPYGALKTPLQAYKSFLLICGGIGVTPLQSIFNSLIHEWQAGRQELLHCVFVWSVRESSYYQYLHDERMWVAHKQANNLGVLPPFFTPMLLEQHEEGAQDRQPTNDQPIVSTQFYLTQAQNAATGLMPLRDGKYSWVRPGRPDLNSVFARMQSYHRADGRCAVLVCGPRSLVKSVRECCVLHSSLGIEFDLHEETFLL